MAPRQRPDDTEGVRIRLLSGMATVELHNPDRKNAVTPPMWGELEAAFRWAGEDDLVRVVIVSGAGADFCSGADLSKEGGADLDYVRSVNAGALALHQVRQPTIARVDGIAAGAGLNLALGCDLVVASDRARFSEIFTRRGLSPDFGGSWLLPRRVGLHKAKELALLAPVVDAFDAERFGLVNRVVPAGELDEAVDAWARQLAAGPPIALAQTKDLLDHAFSYELDDALEAEAVAQARNLTTEDCREAMRAFLDKRPPVFHGK